MFEASLGLQLPCKTGHSSTCHASTLEVKPREVELEVKPGQHRKILLQKEGKKGKYRKGGCVGGYKYRVFCQTGNSSDQSAVSAFTVTQPNLETDEGCWYYW